MRMNCHNQSKPFQWKLNYNYSILNNHGNAANMCIKKTGKKSYRYFPPHTGKNKDAGNVSYSSCFQQIHLKCFTREEKRRES